MNRRGVNPSLSHQDKLPAAQPQSQSTVAMTAVAFQDHWARTLAIGRTIGPRQVGLGPAAKARQRKDVRPVVDTGRTKSKPKASKPEDKEYVLDVKPPPLTLAQKFGLVEAPTQHLTESDWSSVKAKSNARDDSKEPCVICKEDFGLQQQVLLSCSHVFHRACLQAFERYTGRKTCPMCRREQYQTRVIHEGAKMHRVTCATRIQAVWRGYVVRTWYKKLRQTVAPNDPRLRKKFFIDKLEAITDRIVKSCDFDVNSFLSEIDNSLEQSRDIFRHFDAIHRVISDEDWDMIQLKAVERSNQDCPICLTNLTASSQDSSGQDTDRPHGGGDSQGQGQGQGQGTRSRSSPTKFPPIHNSATTKLTKRKTPTAGGKEGGKAGGQGEGGKGGRKGEGEGGRKSEGRKERRTVLLSCTHVFHETCLHTLEELAMGDLRSSCPVCRSVYQKRVITL